MAEKSVRYWDLILKAMVPLCMILGGTIVAHEIRITKIEETRFSDLDGRNLKEEIRAMFPPPWLKEDIDEIKESLKEVNSRLRVLERGG